MDDTRNRAELLVLSFVSLFLELVLVRWLPSYVVFLGFFSNLVLLASFLGLSVGILGSKRRFPFLHLAPLALLASVLLAIGLHYAYLNWHFGVSVLDPRSPSLVYFGSEGRVGDARYTTVPIELVAAVFFALTTLVFLGIGQELGRRFDRAERPLEAYLVNLIASVAGVLAFLLVSWRSLSPVWWFVPPVLCLLPFLPGTGRLRALHALTLLSAAGVAGAVGLGVGFERSIVRWSPYYQIRFDPGPRNLDVNGLRHQAIEELRRQAPVYRLPHALLAAAGRPARDMLVIGAGTGNDVAQALANGVVSLDAVEIDPAILEIGRLYNPEHPYDDPRVHVRIDDGRRVLQERGGKRYDAIAYALVDSLASHSSYGSIRLESYLMTREAFADAKARLAPGGVFVMYNFFRQGFIVSRLSGLLEEVFGSKPLLLSLPPRARIDTDKPESGISVLIAGDTAPLERLFAERGKLCLPDGGAQAALDGARFGASECPGGQLLAPVAVGDSPRSLLPSDDWPFLYLRERGIPAHLLALNATVLAVALLLLVAVSPKAGGESKVEGTRLDLHFLFLGAGFMLLETRSVVQMALVYGATWLTTAVVVLAILVTATLATLLVRVRGIRGRTAAYALLGLSLLLSYLVPATSLVGVAEPWRTAAVFALVGGPVFFSSMVFAVSFASSSSSAYDFGSNILGVVLGALAENLSLLLGFRAMLLVALAFYVLSAVAVRRTRGAEG